MDNTGHSKSYGLPVGLTFSVIILLIHAVVDWLNSGNSQGDSVLWILQALLYFVAALIAASSQFNSQKHMDETLSGVIEAGRGAPMIMSGVMWGYIIVRSLILDDAGMFGGSGVFPFCGFILLDFVVAFSFGNWGGTIIRKRHEEVDPNS